MQDRGANRVSCLTPGAPRPPVIYTGLHSLCFLQWAAGAPSRTWEISILRCVYTLEAALHVADLLPFSHLLKGLEILKYPLHLKGHLQRGQEGQPWAWSEMAICRGGFRGQSSSYPIPSRLCRCGNISPLVPC